MEVQIDVLLEQKRKTRYWLSKQIGVTYPTMMKICNNKTESIKFDIAEKICNALNCKLDDWLIIENKKSID